MANVSFHVDKGELVCCSYFYICSRPDDGDIGGFFAQ